MGISAGPVERAGAVAVAAARHRIVGPAAALAVVGAGAAIIWFADPTTPGGIIPPCPTNALLHVNCPGCGMSRMLYSLLHGDLGAALHFNALGVLFVVLAAASLVTYTAGLWRGRPLRGWHELRYAPMLLLVATLAWFVVRNLPFAPFLALEV